MVVFKRFSLLIFVLSCFSHDSIADDETEMIDALFYLKNHLINLENSVVHDSIAAYRVSSFNEAQPHIDKLDEGDILFPDVDGTLVSLEKFQSWIDYPLVDETIPTRLKNAKKRKVDVLALTSAKHPNKYKEERLEERGIVFSSTFSHLAPLDPKFSNLKKGILCSKGEKKGVTVTRFLKQSFQSEGKKLRKRVIKSCPKRVLIIDNLEENLFDINGSLGSLLNEPPFTEMQVTLLHYDPGA